MALLVVQICNLPYRRFGIGRALVELNASNGADVLRLVGTTQPRSRSRRELLRIRSWHFAVAGAGATFTA